MLRSTLLSLLLCLLLSIPAFAQAPADSTESETLVYTRASDVEHPFTMLTIVTPDEHTAWKSLKDKRDFGIEMTRVQNGDGVIIGTKDTIPTNFPHCFKDHHKLKPTSIVVIRFVDPDDKRRCAPQTHETF